jgi:aspartate oxidase
VSLILAREATHNARRMMAAHDARPIDMAPTLTASAAAWAQIALAEAEIAKAEAYQLALTEGREMFKLMAKRM